MFAKNLKELAPAFSANRMRYSEIDMRDDGIYSLIAIPTLVHCSDKLLNDLEDMEIFAKGQYSGQMPPASEKMMVEVLTPFFEQSDIPKAKPLLLANPIFGSDNPEEIQNFASMMKANAKKCCDTLIQGFKNDSLKTTFNVMAAYHTSAGIERSILMKRAVSLASGRLMENSPGCFIDLLAPSKYPKAYSFPDMKELVQALNNPQEFIFFQVVYEYRLITFGENARIVDDDAAPEEEAYIVQDIPSLSMALKQAAKAMTKK